ncbi:electron transfer flavoprotein subunit beta/FixA family protein [Peptoniphilus catoniae]|uniref:electron transfer flavoprotein subunit beta/FixA family protein n=1 Tax=Peptoniphilus catoniae TaxID=1660341 RepID=UPI0010FD9C71|nr:electron transfer flavoprotein subunit beta/FixA family protein [Peptoniphilus catoniae]
MNIMVCIKQVLDNAIVPTVDQEKKCVIKDGVETMVSPFDQHAIEAALQLVEKHGGEVSVITVGDESCKSALKIGLAMGAEHAYLIHDEKIGEPDAHATAYILAKAIKHIGEFDLVLCGKQAIDADDAQVGAQLAEQLDIPQITFIEEIVEVGEDKITCKRVSSVAEEVVESTMPAVLTCEKSLNEPRYPTLKRTRKANKMEIPVYDLATIGAEDVVQPTSIIKMYPPAPREGGEIITGDAEEIAVIAVKKLVEAKII